MEIRQLPTNYNPFTDSLRNRIINALALGGGGALAGTAIAPGPGTLIGGLGAGITGFFSPGFAVTNADRNRWASEFADPQMSEQALDAFRAQLPLTQSRMDVANLAHAAGTTDRDVQRNYNRQESLLDFQREMLDAGRQHEANLMASQFDFMGGQARADAQMRGLEAGLNYGLGMQGFLSNERIAQGNNTTQYDIANLQALNNLDVTDAQGWWNTINTGMTTGANVEMNRENARTSRYNTDRNARSSERMAGMQTALQARDIANRQLNFWSQQYAR